MHFDAVYSGRVQRGGSYDLALAWSHSIHTLTLLKQKILLNHTHSHKKDVKVYEPPPPQKKKSRPCVNL